MIEASRETTDAMFHHAVRSFAFLIRKPGLKRQTFTSAELATAIRKHYDASLYTDSDERIRFAVEFLETYPDTKIVIGNWGCV